MLSNIYLHLLDRNFRRRVERGELQGRLIPYADDVVLLSPKKPGAELKWIQGFMQRLGLTLHPEKTRVLYIRKGDLNFLGYTHRRRYGRLCLDASKKAQGRIRDELRRKTRRTWLSLEQLVAELNLYTCGARQDFRRIRKRTLSNWTASANNESRGVGRESTPALAHHGRSCKGERSGRQHGLEPWNLLRAISRPDSSGGDDQRGFGARGRGARSLRRGRSTAAQSWLGWMVRVVWAVFIF